MTQADAPGGRRIAVKAMRNKSPAATSILVSGGLRRHGKCSQYRQVLLRFAPCRSSQTKEALIRGDWMKRRLKPHRHATGR
jgi:hypothetical protein